MKIEVLRDGSWIGFEVPPIQGKLTGLEAVRVTGGLKSTRSGANYNWCHQGFEIPSGAPYEPFVRLEFRGGAGIRFLGWHGSSSLECVPEGGSKALSWGGTLVDAPATVWGQEVIDLSRRKERKSLLEAAHAALSSDRLTQGGLSVIQVKASFEKLAESAGISEEILAEIIRQPVRPVVVFNHAIFVDRVVGCDNFRLIETGKGGGVVTSPDHPFDPVRLWEGVWLLSHPFPDRYGSVD